MDLKAQIALTASLADALEARTGGGAVALKIMEAVLDQRGEDARDALAAFARGDDEAAVALALGQREELGPVEPEAPCSECSIATLVRSLDGRGRCWLCAQHKVCADCGEHYTAADGPCPCVVERNELAEARRDADREAFDAAHADHAHEVAA